MHQKKIISKTKDEAPFKYWPPSPPDLNPLDYSIWARMKDDVQGVCHPTVNSLKAKIVEKWAAMERNKFGRCVAFSAAV